jgi:hypothetical protein
VWGVLLRRCWGDGGHGHLGGGNVRLMKWLSCVLNILGSRSVISFAQMDIKIGWVCCDSSQPHRVKSFPGLQNHGRDFDN